jgi:dsRNA-specific ribonuclease
MFNSVFAQPSSSSSVFSQFAAPAQPSSSSMFSQFAAPQVPPQAQPPSIFSQFGAPTSTPAPPPVEIQPPPRPTFSFQSIAPPQQPVASSSVFTPFTPQPVVTTVKAEPVIMQVSKVLSKEDWEAQLLAYVENNMLSLIFPEADDRMKMMGISAKDVDRRAARAGLWIEAFTDPTLGSRNYEVEEKLGDSLLKCLFVDFFTKLYKNFGPDEISKMVAYYASNIVFADIVKKVFPELISYINIDPRLKINDAIVADVFEANFAAIFNASQNQLRGLGHINCEKFLARVLALWFEKSGVSGFDIRYRLGDFKTQISQIFTRNDVQAPREIKTDVIYRGAGGATIQDKSKKRVVVKFNDGGIFQGTKTNNQIGFLRKYNARTPKGLFVGGSIEFDGVGNSKEEALGIAYSKAYEWLFPLEVDSPIYPGERVKVSITWAEQVKAKSDIAIFPEEYTRPLFEKLASEGLDYVTFEKIGKHKIEGQQFVVRMIGRRGDTSKFLTNGVSKGNHIRARRDAIEGYINIFVNLPDSHPFKFTKSTD